MKHATVRFGVLLTFFCLHGCSCDSSSDDNGADGGTMDAALSNDAARDGMMWSWDGANIRQDGGPWVGPDAAVGPRLNGTVTNAGGEPVRGARVTIWDGARFAERRTNDSGQFEFAGVADAVYTLGASSRALAYRELPVTIAGRDESVSIELGTETEPGRWASSATLHPKRSGARTRRPLCRTVA